ncbi:MAG: hypothetical protein II679_01010, partial [Ruminococcus sp.]|nr:hypothetical protein [Ruminococcus sp.]
RQRVGSVTLHPNPPLEAFWGSKKIINGGSAACRQRDAAPKSAFGSVRVQKRSRLKTHVMSKSQAPVFISLFDDRFIKKA